MTNKPLARIRLQVEAAERGGNIYTNVRTDELRELLDELERLTREFARMADTRLVMLPTESGTFTVSGPIAERGSFTFRNLPAGEGDQQLREDDGRAGADE